jgi:hypothetical protein
MFLTKSQKFHPIVNQNIYRYRIVRLWLNFSARVEFEKSKKLLYILFNFEQGII